MPKSVAALSERCTGCKLCLLICSYINLRVFNPSRSHLLIKADEKKGLFDIAFHPECNGCGACIHYCPSEALIADTSLTEEENSNG